MIKEKSSANLLKTDAKFVTNYVISKCFKSGFDNLTTEELAFTLVTPNFSDEFVKQTGEVWTNNYQLRTINKLKKLNVDLAFINYSKGCTQEFSNFFVACSSGNLEAIKEYFRKYKLTELMGLYDVSGKSPLHYAVKQGHMTVVEFLISKGFNSELRDKLFRTPLHLACLLGHAVIAEFLIRTNIEGLNSKDLRGRGCIHFAACAPTSNCLSIILLYSKELIGSVDSYGRTALHYSVLNSSPEQLDIIRILIQSGADMNAADEDGKTIMHYVAEAGITRAIPFLIQKGVDLGRRDSKKQKTAIEVSANDRVRELIIVYSSNPYRPTLLEDRKFLAKGVRGTGVDVQKETLVIGEVTKNRDKFKNTTSKKDNCVVPEFIQNNFYDLMKKLQENGVASNQHIRKPHVFTGSWLEGISTLDGLYERTKNIPASEAILRTFNIICPYEGELSVKTDNQTAIDNFYGMTTQTGFVTDGFSDTRNNPSIIANQSTLMEAQKLAIENIVKNKEIEILNLKEEIIRLKTEKEINQDVIKLELTYNKKIDELKAALRDRDLENKTLRENLDVLRYSQENLKVTNEKLGQDGQLKAQKIKNLQKNIDMLNANIENLQAEIELLKKTDLVTKKSQAIIKTKTVDDKRNFLIKTLTTDEDIAFSKLISMAKKSKINIVSALEKEDGDADGRLTRYEFTTFLQRYLKNAVRVYTIINFFELNKKYNDVYIKDIKEVLEKRNLISERIEQDLLNRLLEAFKRQDIDPEAFDKKFDMHKYDTDGSKGINISEFKGVLEDLQIVDEFDDDSIQKLFSFLDDDDSESITLEELKHRLLSVKLLNDAKSGELQMDKKLKPSSGKIQVAKKLLLANAIPNKIPVMSSNTVNGELKIQFLNLQLAKDSQSVTIKARVPGINKSWIVKKVDSTNIAEFKYACRLPIDNLLPENLGNQLTVVLESESAEAGKAFINWKSTLDTQDKWIVHKNVKFDDESSITVQLRFILSPQPEVFVPKVIKNFKVDKAVDGQLSVKFIELTNFTESIKKNRINVQMSAVNFNGERLSLKPTFDGQRFLFDETFDTEIKLEAGEIANSLQFGLVSNNSEAEVYIDFTEALNFPGTNMQTKYFFLISDNNEHVAKLHCIVSFTNNNIAYSTKVEGSLNIKMHRARNLLTHDMDFFARNPDIDPYFRVKMKLHKDKELIYNTEKVLSNVNPTYNEDILFDVEMAKAIDFATERQIVPPLIVEMWDYNKGDEKLVAACGVNWGEAYDSAGTWAINEYMELYEASGKIMGEVYLSCNYMPKDFEGEVHDCVDIESKVATETIRNRVLGKFYLKAIYLMDLFYINSNSIVEKEKKIRPFIEILMPNNKRYQSLTSKLSEKFTDVDIYMINEDFETEFDFDGIDAIKDIKIFVKHEEDFSNNDKIISSLKVPLAECIKCPGDWVINQPFYLLHDPEALSKTGLSDVGRILLQARFIPDKTYSNSLCPKLPDYFEKYLDIDKIYEGKLVFNLLNCKDLPVSDSGLEGKSADPFVVFSLVGAEKAKVKSEIIKNSLNPAFNQTLSFDIAISQSNIDQYSIKVEVFDYDRFNGNEFIGNIFIQDVLTILNRPNEWAIDKVLNIKLAKPNPQLQSQMYLQVKFETKA